MIPENIPPGWFARSAAGEELTRGLKGVTEDAINKESMSLTRDQVHAYGAGGAFIASFSVDEYGDIAAAGKAALSAVSSVGGGLVEFGTAPESNPYKLPSDFDGFDVPSRTTVKGQGPRSTVFEMSADVTESVFDLGADDGSGTRNFGVNLSDLQISSPEDSNNEPLYGGVTAIRGDRWGAGTMTRVKVSAFEGSGLSYHRSWDCDLHACTFAVCGDPVAGQPVISLDGDTSENSNHLTMNQCHIERYRHVGLDLRNDVRKIRVHNTKIHGTDGGSHPAILIASGDLSFPVPEEITITKTQFDLPSSGPTVRIIDGHGIKINDTSFHHVADQGATEAFKIEGGRDLKIGDFDIGTRRSAHPPDDYGFNVSGGRDIEIRDGSIDGEGAASNPNALQAGILVQSSPSDVTISNVTVKHSAADGISVSGTRCKVIGCQVYDCAEGNSTSSGIVASGTDCIFKGNHSYDTRSSGSKTQQYGIRDAGDYNVYVGNNLRGNADSAFWGNAGANSLKNANIV